MYNLGVKICSKASLGLISRLEVRNKLSCDLTQIPKFYCGTWGIFLMKDDLMVPPWGWFLDEVQCANRLFHDK